MQENWLPEAAVYASMLENELFLLWLCDKSEDILVDIHKSRDKLQPRKSARLLWICIQITTYFTTATYYMIDREIDQYDRCNQIMPRLAILISTHLDFFYWGEFERWHLTLNKESTILNSNGFDLTSHWIEPFFTFIFLFNLDYLLDRKI